MKLERCIECGSTELEQIMDWMVVTVKGKPVTIENIPTVRCTSCGETYTDVAANRYIDKQIAKAQA